LDTLLKDLLGCKEKQYVFHMRWEKLKQAHGSTLPLFGDFKCVWLADSRAYLA
jgi:hypothetical protein